MQKARDSAKEPPGSMESLLDYLRAEWSDATINLDDLSFLGFGKSPHSDCDTWYWRISAKTEMYAFIMLMPNDEVLYGMDAVCPVFSQSSE